MVISRSVQRFVLGAGYCFVFAYGCTWLITTYISLSKAHAYALVQTMMFVINFFVARRWVFSDATTSLKAQAIGFIAVAAVCRLFDWLSFTLLLWWLPSTRLSIAVLFAMALVFPVKYTMYRNFVFHTRG